MLDMFPIVQAYGRGLRSTGTTDEIVCLFFLMRVLFGNMKD